MIWTDFDPVILQRVEYFDEESPHYTAKGNASSGSARIEAAGHNGVDEFEITEFLAQDGAAPAELIKILFGRVPVDA